MELKELGNSGVMVPEIGIGVWRYSGGVEPLRRGIELGAFLIDTAEVYGTEDAVGQANNLRHDDVLKAAEGSLRRLRTQYIDLYQVHWPSSNVPIQETMHAMEELVDRGLVRYIGVSNFSTAELLTAQAAMRKYSIVSNQVLYNLNQRGIEVDLLPYCQKQQITVIAYTPSDSGRLTKRSRLRSNRKTQVLEDVTAQTQKTLAQVALNWCTSRSNVIAIPKSNGVDRVVENCRASGWRLSPAQSTPWIKLSPKPEGYYFESFRSPLDGSHEPFALPSN